MIVKKDTKAKKQILMLLFQKLRKFTQNNKYNDNSMSSMIQKSIL